jgi:hypothetical protein
MDVLAPVISRAKHGGQVARETGLRGGLMQNTFPLPQQRDQVDSYPWKPKVCWKCLLQ